MIRVLLVEDQVALHASLQWFLERGGDVEVVAIAADGRTAVELARARDPQVVVMDLMLPDMSGIEVTRRIRAASPDCRVVAFTAIDNPRVAREMLDAGASGFVRKARSGDNVIDAIRAAARNQSYFAPDLFAQLEGANGDDRPVCNPDGLTLTPRELEVLCHLGSGESLKEIAFGLHVSVDAVEYQRKRIMIKLGIDNGADLVKYAIQIGATPLDY